MSKKCGGFEVIKITLGVYIAVPPPPKAFLIKPLETFVN